MSQVASKIEIDTDFSTGELPTIIVGTGPVGIRALQSILQHDPESPVVIFGDEPWAPYNRVKLSSFLAGEIKWDELIDSQIKMETRSVIQRHNCAIIEIDRLKKCVIDEFGQAYQYKKLILALGSKPHIPNIPGKNLGRVYTFRDLNDAQNLLARRVSSRSTVVIGGGLLGIECARAMTKQNTRVSIVDHSGWLMSQQLDENAAAYLNEHVMTLGVRTYLGSGVKTVIGEDKVTGIELLNGKIIECDTVIFATGIVPNIDLARAAKLSVGRGVRVNNNMQTTDPDIYAIGECAQHNDKIYGIVSPGFEQAEVAVHHLFGKKANYTGSLCATQLKVAGINIFSMGNIGIEEPESNFSVYMYENYSKRIYRKLFLKSNRIVGFIAVGELSSRNRLQEAINHQRRVWPWQISAFLSTGEPWKEESSNNIHQWPASSIVCNCMGVTRGTCSKAIETGCDTIEKLMNTTNASTVCGSCRPLLAGLLGSSARMERIKALKSFFVISLLSLVLSVAIFLLPSLHYPETVIEQLNWDILWRNNTLKQISGFAILGLALIGLLVSLRKRWKRFSILDFSFWRYVHIALGLTGLTVIFLHTGFRFGSNLNMWLMAAFSALLLAGSLMGVFMAFQHKLDAARAKNIRDTLLWAHILTFWPVPALLVMHITKSYYF
jgi:nitrite reductase (NADH) large subunit